MLPLTKPYHTFALPLVECTILGLPLPSGKLYPRKCGLLQADTMIAFSATLFQPLITLIISITFGKQYLRHWGQVPNTNDICFLQFDSCLQSLHSQSCSLPGTLEGGPCVDVQLDDVVWLTSLYFLYPGGTHCASGEGGHFPGSCVGGIIWALPWPPRWRSYPFHCSLYLGNPWLVLVVDCELGVMLNGE